MPRAPRPVRPLRVKNFAHLHKHLYKNACPHYVYRGAAKYDYDLTPRIGRKLGRPDGDESERAFRRDERILFEVFRSRALIHFSHATFNDWHWLTLAQHFGLATRFLDWTENPLVALYFAVIDHPKEDGALYAYHANRILAASDNASPFEITGNAMFLAPHLTNRLVAQSALFSVQPRPWESFDDARVVKFCIPPRVKAELREMLPRYGVSRRMLFADLDSYGVELDAFMEARRCKSGEPFELVTASASDHPGRAASAPE